MPAGLQNTCAALTAGRRLPFRNLGSWGHPGLLLGKPACPPTAYQLHTGVCAMPSWPAPNAGVMYSPRPAFGFHSIAPGPPRVRRIRRVRRVRQIGVPRSSVDYQVDAESGWKKRGLTPSKQGVRSLFSDRSQAYPGQVANAFGLKNARRMLLGRALGLVVRLTNLRDHYLCKCTSPAGVPIARSRVQ
jgi:hypothetical protein